MNVSTVDFRSCVHAARAAWVAAKQRSDAAYAAWEDAYDAWEEAGYPKEGVLFQAKVAASRSIREADKSESIAKQAWIDGLNLL